jgi:hypothetical protein
MPVLLCSTASLLLWERFRSCWFRVSRLRWDCRFVVHPLEVGIGCLVLAKVICLDQAVMVLSGTDLNGWDWSSIFLNSDSESASVAWSKPFQDVSYKILGLAQDCQQGQKRTMNLVKQTSAVSDLGCGL